MSEVNLHCSCCRLDVKGHKQEGRRRFTVYDYNGVEYVGLKSLGAVVGMTADMTRQRIAAECCLLASTSELSQAKRRKHERRNVTSRNLAAAFCRMPRPAV